MKCTPQRRRDTSHEEEDGGGAAVVVVSTTTVYTDYIQTLSRITTRSNVTTMPMHARVRLYQLAFQVMCRDKQWPQRSPKCVVALSALRNTVLSLGEGDAVDKKNNSAPSLSRTDIHCLPTRARFLPVDQLRVYMINRISLLDALPLYVRTHFTEAQGNAWVREWLLDILSTLAEASNWNTQTTAAHWGRMVSFFVLHSGMVEHQHHRGGGGHRTRNGEQPSPTANADDDPATTTGSLGATRDAILERLRSESAPERRKRLTRFRCVHCHNRQTVATYRHVAARLYCDVWSVATRHEINQLFPRTNFVRMHDHEQAQQQHGLFTDLDHFDTGGVFLLSAGGGSGDGLEQQHLSSHQHYYPTRKHLTVEHIKSLFAREASPMYRLVLGILLSTGLRSGAVCRLRLVDLCDTPTTPPPTTAVTCGGHDEDGCPALSPTTDGAHAHTIRDIGIAFEKGHRIHRFRINDGMRLLLETWLRVRCTLNMSNHPYIFPSQMYGNAHACAVSVRSWFSRLAQACGIPRSMCHLHSLRHTFATQLFQRGVSITQIQRALGHTNPELTWMYIGSDSSDTVAVMDRYRDMPPTVHIPLAHDESGCY
jgi:integrase